VFQEFEAPTLQDSQHRPLVRHATVKAAKERDTRWPLYAMIILKLILEEQFVLTEWQCHGIRTNIVDCVQIKINFPVMQAQELGIS
jgi:hypothetical protein